MFMKQRVHGTKARTRACDFGATVALRLKFRQLFSAGEKRQQETLSSRNSDTLCRALLIACEEQDHCCDRKCDSGICNHRERGPVGSQQCCEH